MMNEHKYVEVVNDRWRSDKDISYLAVPELFLGPYFEWCEECEVKSLGTGKWFPAYFCSYDPGSKFPVNVFNDLDELKEGEVDQYKQIRRPELQQKPFDKVEKWIDHLRDNIGKLNELLEYMQGVKS